MSDETWWVMSEARLTELLHRVRNGDDPDVIIAEEYANSEEPSGHICYPAWGALTQADVTGRIGLAENEYGTPVTVFVCEACHALFSVTGDVDPATFGNACLGLECDSYDVERDVDLMFEVEPWRIRRDAGESNE